MTDFVTEPQPQAASPSDIIAGRTTKKTAPELLGDNRILFHGRASLLTGLFPDELIVQEKSITIVHNCFLTSKDDTINLKDVGRVVAENTAFFTALRIIGKIPQHELFIKGIWSKQAAVGKEIIESLLLEQPEEPVAIAQSAQTTASAPSSPYVPTGQTLLPTADPPVQLHK
jgi:hypothetical protein